MSLFTFFGEYYYLRQRLPIFLYVFYSLFKKVDHPIIDAAIKASLILIKFITLYSFAGLILRIPFTNLIPFQWNYQGVLTWEVFSIAYYRFAQHSKLNKLTSFCLTSLAAVGGGWLYEVPFYHPIGMFIHHNSIFYINAQIICLLLLAYELWKMKFKPNIPIYITLGLLTLSSALLFNNLPLLRPAHTWIMRIPTCLFLISLLSGIDLTIIPTCLTCGAPNPMLTCFGIAPGEYCGPKCFDIARDRIIAEHRQASAKLVEHEPLLKSIPTMHEVEEC